MANIKFSVKLMDFDQETALKLRRLDQERSDLINKAIFSFKNSPRFQAARDVATLGNYGEKEPTIKFDGTSFNVTIPCDIESDEAPAKSTYRPPLSISEKTLNALLQGKILSDSEKRKLISAATGGLIQEEQPKEEVEK
jgi:hypothetical protein